MGYRIHINFILSSSWSDFEKISGQLADHNPLHMPSASIVIAELVQGSESPSLFTAKTLKNKLLVLHSISFIINF